MTQEENDLRLREKNKKVKESETPERCYWNGSSCAYKEIPEPEDLVELQNVIVNISPCAKCGNRNDEVVKKGTTDEEKFKIFLWELHIIIRKNEVGVADGLSFENGIRKELKYQIGSEDAIKQIKLLFLGQKESKGVLENTNALKECSLGHPMFYYDEECLECFGYNPGNL